MRFLVKQLAVGDCRLEGLLFIKIKENFEVGILLLFSLFSIQIIKEEIPSYVFQRSLPKF